jgi:hypothetical protein
VRGVDRPHGVILVDLRYAENGHESVSDVFSTVPCIV